MQKTTRIQSIRQKSPKRSTQFKSFRGATVKQKTKNVEEVQAYGTQALQSFDENTKIDSIGINSLQ